MSSSRLAVDPHGRLVAVVTTGEDVGLRFRVLAMDEFGFEPKGRPPTLEQQRRAVTPYGKPWASTPAVGGALGPRQGRKQALASPPVTLRGLLS